MDSSIHKENVLHNLAKLKPFKIVRLGNWRRNRNFKKYRNKSHGKTQARINVDGEKTPDTSTSTNGEAEWLNSRPSLLPIQESVNIHVTRSSSTVTPDTEKNSAKESLPQSEVKIKYISQSDPTVQSIVHIESIVYKKKSNEEKKQTPPESTINSYACHLCKYTIEKLFNFRLHLAQHTVDPERLIPVSARQCQLKCGICGYFGTSKEDLALHVEEHAFQKRFLCAYCKKDFSKRRQILRHAAKRHKREELCFYDRRILYQKLMKLPDWMVRMNPEVLLDSEEVSNYLEQQKLD
ncbi:zinc finger protein ZFAT [Biomphalaria pfeifferi]|uniref:Zinc finger protein ZFAT n=1 Tax=Biomphalaria pfeifferi TaxID=112525 RepID=A0AAD8BZ03_BIOPF|nr:zinc finger protein ZFAT [Biomphalaria pfeifferi]